MGFFTPFLQKCFYMYKLEVVTLSIGIAHFLNSRCLHPQNPTSSQRDLHFLISHCHKSSVCSVFNSGICNFLFSAVANILLARFSTAGFTFLSFPLSKFLCLPSFQQRDLQFLIFRCCKHSSCPIFNGRICISQFSAVYGIFAEKEDLNNLRFLKQPSPDNPEFCERKPLDKRRFELFYHEQHKCKKGVYLSLKSMYPQAEKVAKGSNTTSPLSELARISFAMSFSGFWVG